MRVGYDDFWDSVIEVKDAFDRLKDKIRLKEGSRIKNEYMLTLGKLVLLGTLILFVINCFLHYKIIDTVYDTTYNINKKYKNVKMG